MKINVTPSSLGGALLLAGLVVTTNIIPARAQFSKISEQQEIEAGKQTAAQAIKEYGPPLSANDPRQRRVSRIGAMFAAQSTRKNIPFTYTVLQNDKILNAFAGPGGPIFVTTKTVATTANDAELAYVLGHETGHIEHRDVVNAAAKQQKTGLFVGILGAILSRGKSGDVFGAVTNVTYGLWQKGFSREQESNADAYGVQAMAKLGFDPRAAVSMLGKLGDGPDGLQKYLSDHPTSQAREQKVTEEIKDQNLIQVAQRVGGPKLNLGGADGQIYNPPVASSPISSNGNLNLSAPLRVVDSGGFRVVLAPVAALADYAGGKARAQDAQTVVVQRGENSLTLQVDSDVATLNGRQVRLSAAPRVIDGRFYAPLGSVAAGLGGTASYDSTRNAVRIDFDGRGGYLSLP